MERDRDMGAAVRRIAGALAWLVLAVIAFSTLSPVGMRPHLGTLVHVERFGAFALMGFLFGVIHPRRLGLVGLCVVAVAVGLELLQTVAFDRHARVVDFAIKAAGGAGGVAAAWLFLRNRRLVERVLGRLNRNTSSSR